MNNKQSQITEKPVMPTSFWDFRNKKVYSNKKDKIIDFVLGSMGIPLFYIILFSLFEKALYFIFGQWVPNLFGYIELYGTIFLWAVLLIYIRRNREYVFWGLIVFVFIFLFGVFSLRS
ncbi:hypothetical protein KKG29_02805 [Patescibacteria group bacterium]|nr:hypothetical protein [Patescibacteria group bacterium]MBU4000080.1 hypothetical protein [Patescibacteria group bacterium]MBU4056904.1 hypothetical protein [Patescibacteria group bacterium]MBU4368582.1 hypothetical protein [Patescibacteria group bacterium]